MKLMELLAVHFTVGYARSVVHIKISLRNLHGVLCALPTVFCFVTQVYVPSMGDITLHFCEPCAIPSETGSGGSKEVPGNSIVFRTEHGLSSNQTKIEESDSKDSQYKVTVQGITMGGCTLFPGSQVLGPPFTGRVCSLPATYVCNTLLLHIYLCMRMKFV
jgi:hypothetical protein